MKKFIKAPREKVFAAWKDPALLKRWFAPGALQVPDVEIDFRVGGSFSIAMEGEMRGKQTSGRMTGTYREISPVERLVFACTGTWRGSAPQTVVTVEFEEVDNGTEIRLVQEGFVDAQDCEGHQHGWGSTLEKLGEAVRRSL
jgi:uncharacterized protein YndB with AHSA1/START domain